MVSVQQLWKREYSNARYERWPNNVDPVQMAAFRLREKLRSISVLRPGDRILSIPGIGVQTSRRTVASGAAAWWLAGGAPTPIAVYQPKGAASLAASYVNLVNPGTYDAAPGVAPSFDAATGWTFDGSSKYLVAIVPGAAYSYLVRYSDGSSANKIIIGAYDAANPSARADLRPYWVGSRLYLYGNSLSTGGPSAVAGVMGSAGNQGYFDGMPDGTGAGVWSGTTTRQIFIGALNNSGAAAFHWGGKIQAVAAWDTSTGYATWMPAVMAAVALI